MIIVPENKVPSKEQIDNLITIALDEDIGLGDITTRSIVSPDAIYVAEILTRENIGPVDDAIIIGEELGSKLLKMGANEILEKLT